MRSTLGGLDVVTVQLAGGPPKGVVVLCHGFGAPGTDLVGLAEALVSIEPRLANVRFHFPAAPLSLGNLGFGESRAWWLIDFEAIEALRTASPEALRAFRKAEPPGMAAARKALSAMVSEALNASRLAMNQLVLGGFSQGAMISTDVALRLEEPPAGLAILSGTLVTEDVWGPKAKARAGLPVFQSHGRGDQVLPFMAAQWLTELLVSNGLEVDFRPFNGGHEIPEQVIEGLASFLATRLRLTS